MHYVQIFSKYNPLIFFFFFNDSLKAYTLFLLRRTEICDMAILCEEEGMLLQLLFVHIVGADWDLT